MPEAADPSRPPAETTAPRRFRLLVYLVDLARASFARLLRVRDEDKLNIYTEVFHNAEFADLNYWLEAIFSIGIATLGLIINSPAVVIGAMLVSPLMGPIIGSGMAIALGDFYLGLKSLTNVLLSIVVSVLFAALITWVLPFHSPTAEILSRVQPTILDLAIAILSGMAGAIVVARGASGGGITALPGVAVAVALMPPLGVVGFGVGIGWDWAIIRGGGLLFLTNLVAIILSSVLVFFSVRMDAPAVRVQIGDWLKGQEKSDSFYQAVERTPLRRLVGTVGTPARRLLILLIFLALVAYPLQQSLWRLTREAQIRKLVVDDLHEFIPAGSVFQNDLEILPDRIKVRVVAVLPTGFPPEQDRRLEDLIRTETGRTTEVVVYNVATRDELTALTASPTSRRGTSLQPLTEIRTEVLARVGQAVISTWPSDIAPLLDNQTIFDPDDPAATVKIVYLANQDLGQLGEAAVRKALRERIGASLNVTFERVPSLWQVSFNSKSTALSQEHKALLNELASVLLRIPRLECTVGISAPTGQRPNATATQRVQSVEDYLTRDRDIAPGRIKKESSQAEHDTVPLELRLSER